MIYPETSKKGPLTIGVTAPSSGLGRQDFKDKFRAVKEFHESHGCSIDLGNCLEENERHVSASRQERAEEFMEMWARSDIDLILPPWGGEFLIDTLELLDFDKLKESPRWVQGYSDISTLLFAITTRTGIATAHGVNFMDSASADALTKHSFDYLRASTEETIVQHSSEMYQQSFPDDVTDLNYNLKCQTKWSFLKGEVPSLTGRMIGGCIDVLQNLVGTPFGDLPGYVEREAPEGILLYLENCEMKPTDLYRALYQMKYAGWFEHVNGFIFGRSGFEAAAGESFEVTENEVILDVLADLDIPIVIDADIGHKPPNMLIVNGAFGELTKENDSFVLKQTLS